MRYGEGALRYMIREGPQTHQTEADVSSPPALFITDEAGIVWSTGPVCRGVIGNRYAFDILANGRPTGETATHIERYRGKIRIFTADGIKRWTGSAFI